MKLSELKGKKVVAVAEATKVGAVYDALLGSSYRNIEALVIRADERGPEYVVLSKSINAIGQDVVTIDSTNSLQDFEQVPDATRFPRVSSLLKSQIVTQSGEVLGEISDFDFDPIAGEIRGLEYRGSSLEGLLGRHHVLDPKSIISFGPGIVTVTDEARPSQAA